MRAVVSTVLLLVAAFSVGVAPAGQDDIRPRPWSVVPAECFHAFWAHGSSVQIENPEAVAQVTRYGFATRVMGRPNASGWFHFAIPTPVIGTCYSRRAGEEISFRYRLWRVFTVLRTSGRDVRVTSVHVWDGDLRRATYDNHRLTRTVGLDVTWNIPEWPEVIYGVGVSIKVEFSPTGGWVDFISAGADFLLAGACACRQ